MNDDAPAQHPPLDHDPDDAVAAYALGVLDADERQQAEAHLAGCAACRAALARYEEVVGALGTSAPPVGPRPGVRDALLAEIRATDVSDGPVPLRRRSTMIGLGLVAVAALISIVVLSLLLARTLDERDAARYAEHEIAEYLRDGGTLSALRPAPGAPPEASPGHGALAVVPDGSQAMLVLYDLPATGEDRRYLAWMEGDGGRVELGELRVSDEGVGWLVFSGPEPMPAYDTVGISRVTDEAPEGEPFLVAPVR